MANRVVKPSGKGSEVNGEGNEKDNSTSTSKIELANFSIHDPNSKLAGLANGYRQRP